jgi:hypothetical protein
MRIGIAVRLGVLLALALSACGGEWDTRVKDCSPEGITDIGRALDAIVDHRGSLIEELSFFSGAEFDVLRNMRKVKITCVDDRAICSDSTLLARADGYGNNFQLCYENIRSQTNSLCVLAGVILHEKAHTDKVPAWPLHNHSNPPLAIRLGDPLYRAQRIAQDQCQFEWDLNDRELTRP